MSSMHIDPVSISNLFALYNLRYFYFVIGVKASLSKAFTIVGGLSSSYYSSFII